jgi:hypothetical protein
MTIHIESAHQTISISEPILLAIYADLDQRDKDALDLMFYGADSRLSSGKGIPWLNRLGEILQHVLPVLKQDIQTPR